MSDFESGVGEWQVILRVGWGGNVFLKVGWVVVSKFEKRVAGVGGEQF